MSINWIGNHNKRLTMSTMFSNKLLMYLQYNYDSKGFVTDTNISLASEKGREQSSKVGND